MKTAITILICRLLRFAGSLLGRGSSLPGEIALKLCPDILSRVRLPRTVIAVTGSNGKTSTVEMIAHILTSAGKSFAYNREGSNQIEGVTALILCSCTLSGRFRKDILLIESDERYAKHTFKYVKPTHYVITNLYRDQLTRNGHPEWVYDAIKDSIPESCRLIVNADDPLVSLFARGRENTVRFGMDRQSFSTDENTGVYDDGKYCPVCFGRMEYSFRHYNHIGSYRCTSCGYRREEPDHRITLADLDAGYLIIDGKNRIDLAFRSIYNAYNILACYTLCREIGLDGGFVASGISNYVLKNGRVVNFRLGATEGMLITSKHENSVSYDQSLRYISQQKEPHAVSVTVDAISRKYFTSDTSWLWDIDFDLLDIPETEHIYLCGRYADDLAVRFSYTGIDPEKITVTESIPESLDAIKKSGHGRLYAVTCFSDKDKILSRVERG